MIDTPGVINSTTVKLIRGMKRQAKYAVGFEVAKMFLYAPRGFNAILLLVNYGSRFTRDDSDALQMLLKLLTTDALKYMILVLTHGDYAEYNASDKGIAVEEYLKNWIDSMADGPKTFIHDSIKDRVVLFNCRLKPDKEPGAYKKQLCKLIEVNINY